MLIEIEIVTALMMVIGVVSVSGWIWFSELEQDSRNLHYFLAGSLKDAVEQTDKANRRPQSLLILIEASKSKLAVES